MYELDFNLWILASALSISFNFGISFTLQQITITLRLLLESPFRFAKDLV